MKLQVDIDPGKLTVSGERLVNNSKCIYFEQTFKLPQNSDTDNITGKFDGEILHVTVPKQEETSEEPALNQPNTIGDQKNNNELLEEKESSSNSRDGYRLVPRKCWGQEDEATTFRKGFEDNEEKQGDFAYGCFSIFTWGFSWDIQVVKMININIF